MSMLPFSLKLKLHYHALCPYRLFMYAPPPPFPHSFKTAHPQHYIQYHTYMT